MRSLRKLRFAGALVLGGCVAAPPAPVPHFMPPPTPSTPPAPTTCALDPGLVAEQARLLAAINQERRNRGLTPVTREARLAAAAQDFACVTARQGVLNHRGPDGTRPGDRAARAGYDYRIVGENLGLGFISAEQAMFYWMRSPGHRDNVLAPQMNEAALGLAQSAAGQRVWVLLLGRQR